MTDATGRPADRSGGSGSRRGWLARRLLPGGQEPDPRFSLANERTFLAWIRTSLALVGGAIAVEAFAGGVFTGVTRSVLAFGLASLALMTSMTAGLRWLRVERAMRARQPLPIPALVPVLIGGVLAGVLLTLAIIWANAG